MPGIESAKDKMRNSKLDCPTIPTALENTVNATSRFCHLVIDVDRGFFVSLNGMWTFAGTR
jgi:hypothetical protein